MIKHIDFNCRKVITVPSTKIIVTRPEGVTNLPHYKNSRPENLSGSEEKIGGIHPEGGLRVPKWLHLPNDLTTEL